MRTEQIAAQALERVNNDRYVLSIMVARRAKELSDGALPLVKADKTKTKFTDIAMMEIAQDKLVLEDIVNE